MYTLLTASSGLFRNVGVRQGSREEALNSKTLFFLNKEVRRAFSIIQTFLHNQI